VTESTSTAIDVHAHAVPATLLAELAAGGKRFPHVEVRRHEQSHVVSFNGGDPTRPIAPGLTDGDRRTRWLDEQGIARQVVGGWLDIFGYQLPADEGDDWATALTEAIAELGRQDDRIIGLGTVPLQDPERAAEAVRRIRKSGLPGVLIATRAGEHELDDERFTPFWAAADETGAVVYLHPGFGAASPRYRDFGLVNGLARVEDSTVTMARLLCAGIPARYPGMKLVVAHGGGALPYVLGRLRRNHVINPDTTADPMESFAALYFDSVVFDPKALAFLVDLVGPDRVLLGSDYPFPIGDLTPRGVLDQAGLPERTHAAILGGTARALFAPAGGGADR
jgi:aminocarboxymuconate-semialdehyde decarboxylase